MDSGQIYSTNNLTTFNQNGSQTTSAWQNVGQWGGQLTCWAPGGQGYCGPLPYVNANGQGMINFSYGYTDLYQIVNIAAALPNSGTGLRVNGFTFGFTAKNGNGWDGGSQDYLAAYVKFYDNNGSLTRYYDYSLQTNRVYNWTTFNFSETFQTPYASKDLSTVQYGFVGYDTNFWAGPYGPEIYNVSFSLKYSVDPCAINVLYSPSCPGYMDALAKLLPTTTIEPVSTTTSTTTATTTVTTTVTADPIAPTVTVTSAPSSSSTTSSTTPTTSTTTATTGTSNTATTTTSTPTAAATKEGGPAQGSSGGTSLGLSVIARNQQREQAIATQAAQNAISTATSAAVQSQQEATSIASQSASNSTSFASSTNPSMSSGTGLRVGASNQSLSQLPGMMGDNIQGPNSFQLQQNQSTNIGSISATQEVKPLYSFSTTQQSMTNFSVDSPLSITNDFLTNRTNPINEIVEAKQNVPQTNASQSIGSIVNRNVGDNDLASGVSIDKMANVPVGYSGYLNFTLKDATFYASKEVYANQRNVDNARVLRQLTNDSKHREMVDQQYRR